jgi:hypothetical protein
MGDVMPDTEPDDGDALLDEGFDDDGEGLLLVLFPPSRTLPLDEWI